MSSATAPVTDLTVREIARAAQSVLGRPVQLTHDTDIALALMNIVMELEDAFDVSIPLDRLASVRTVGELSGLVNDLRMKV